MMRHDTSTFGVSWSAILNRSWCTIPLEWQGGRKRANFPKPCPNLWRLCMRHIQCPLSSFRQIALTRHVLNVLRCPKHNPCNPPCPTYLFRWIGTAKGWSDRTCSRLRQGTYLTKTACHRWEPCFASPSKDLRRYVAQSQLQSCNLPLPCPSGFCHLPCTYPAQVRMKRTTCTHVAWCQIVPGQRSWTLLAWVVLQPPRCCLSAVIH